MAKLCIFISVFIFNCLLLHSQIPVGLIRVKVTDFAKHTLTNASVAIFHNRDSTPLQTAITQSDGYVTFSNLPFGAYSVSATYIGFARSVSSTIVISKNIGNVDVNLELLEAVDTLKSVRLKTIPRLIDNKIDRTVVNVNSYVTNAGNSVLDAIGNTPNVTVDINGTISLKGRAGVMILIDNKPVYLNSANLMTYLKAIPAADVEELEIMTQPSANFDAAGNAGVINIKLKKNRQSGFNLTVSLNYVQGLYPKSMNALNFSCKIMKWNIYANIAWQYFKSFTDRHVIRHVTDPNRVAGVIYEQYQSDVPEYRPYQLYSGGVDYQLNARWSFRSVISANSSRLTRTSFSHSSLRNAANDSLELIVDGTNVQENPWNNYSVAAYIEHIISTKKNVQLNANYEMFHFNTLQRSINQSYDQNGSFIMAEGNPFIQKAQLPSIIKIYSIKADYSWSICEDAKLEFGAKSGFIYSDNSSQFYFFTNGIYHIDSNLTNFYNYRENINAVYANYHRQWKKWELQLGLRTEQTNNAGLQRVNTQVFNKSYLQLFPTAYLTYEPVTNHNFSLTYGRRIDRPDYFDLNPFIYLIDQFTIQKGNPALIPYFTNNIEWSYNYKRKLNASLNYTATNNMINYVYFPADTGKLTIETKKNLGYYTNMGLSVNYNTNINKWYTIIASYNLYRNHFQGPLNNTYVEQSRITNLVSATQQFRYQDWVIEFMVPTPQPIFIPFICMAQEKH